MAKTISVRVNLKGFNIVDARVKNAIKTGMRKIGFAIERDARIFAPRDTGRLKGSITSRVKESSVFISANTNYADIMEQPGNVRREGRRPYLRPALTKNIGKIKSILTNELRRALR